MANFFAKQAKEARELLEAEEARRARQLDHISEQFAAWEMWRATEEEQALPRTQADPVSAAVMQELAEVKQQLVELKLAAQQAKTAEPDVASLKAGPPQGPYSARPKKSALPTAVGPFSSRTKYASPAWQCAGAGPARPVQYAGAVQKEVERRG